MARFSATQVSALLAQCSNGATPQERGRAAENLLSHMFEKVAGVKVRHRNRLDAAGAQEVDLVMWNQRRPTGLYFLPEVLLLESKQWAVPVGNEQVVYFDKKVKDRYLTHAFLYAARGITGDAGDLSAANSTIADALKEGRHIIVLNHAEIAGLVDGAGLVDLIVEKLCLLAATRTSIR